MSVENDLVWLSITQIILTIIVKIIFMVLTVLIVHRVRVCYANLLYDINQSIKLYCVCYVDVLQQSCRRGEAAVM
jgi:hypothetical protein